MFFAYLAPTQMLANGCGDAEVNKAVCDNAHFSKLTPDMVGITTTRNDVSVSNFDVSTHFGLSHGSIQVSFNSVDVIERNGELAFFLAGSGDNIASWTINYDSQKPVRVAHGGALAGNEDDIFVSKDANIYTFSGALQGGLTHNKSGNTYKVHNSTSSKISNAQDFTWTSNGQANLFKFEIKTTANSVEGKGSRYDIYIDDSACTEVNDEQCDDANTNSGDGCSSTCQVEANYVCKTDLDNDSVCDTGGIGTVVAVINSCGDGKLNGTECEPTHFSQLTPDMVGITSTRNHVSVSNYDVSSHFNLPAGSIEVTFSSVDVILKNGTLAFFLAGNGDTRSTWNISYASNKLVQIKHGDALAGGEDDLFISTDATSYSFNGGLTSGLSHSVSSGTYKVHNSTGSKIFNATGFEWTANTGKESFNFKVNTTATSAAGKGSKYTIYVDDSSCQEISNERCDDANTINGDGCSDTCQVEGGYVCQEDLATATWSTMYNYSATCNSTGSNSVTIWSMP